MVRFLFLSFALYLCRSGHVQCIILTVPINDYFIFKLSSGSVLFAYKDIAARVSILSGSPIGRLAWVYSADDVFSQSVKYFSIILGCLD